MNYLDSSDSDSYEVKEILDCRIFRKQLEFLVLWASQATPTWQPASDVRGSPFLLIDFFRNKYRDTSRKDIGVQQEVKSTKELDISELIKSEPKKDINVPASIVSLDKNVVHYIDKNNNSCFLQSELFAEYFPHMFVDFVKSQYIAALKK